MKKVLLGLLATVLIFTSIGCASESKSTSKSEDTKKVQSKTKSKEKKGILVVSFGTSYPDARKLCIESTENKIKEAFPDYEVKRAFTSNIIIKKLKERDNISIDTVELALEKMKKDGFTEVIVQPLHIMPGTEYDVIVEMVQKFINNKSFSKIVLGRPVLYREKDYEIAIEALKAQLPNFKNNEAVILMGHGSAHPANSTYSELQYMLWEKGLKNVYVGTVEGFPTLTNIIPKLKEKGVKKVTLVPFMLVAGDHAKNDMAGDEDDSWKNVLKSKGFEVETYIHGLGENKKIQDIYVNHVKDCINGNPLMEEKE